MLLAEMRRRRRQFSELLLRMHFLRPGVEHLFALDMVRVRHAAIHRANRRALLLVKVPHTLCALLRDDIIEIVRKRIKHLPLVLVLHSPGVNRRVRALGFARAAVDALFGYHRGHSETSSVVETLSTT